MFNLVYNKPNKTKICIYVDAGKALHSSNRLQASGSTQHRNEKEKMKSNNEHMVPNRKRRLFVNSDYYKNIRRDSSKILSIIQNKFSTLCTDINSNRSNENKSLVKVNGLLKDCRHNLVNFNYLQYIRTKFQKTYQIGEEITGMDKIRLVQERVFSEQNKLKELQDCIRDMKLKLTAIRKHLQQIDLDKLRYARDDDRYLDLIRQESDIMHDERELLERLEIANIEEREIFSHLATVATVSHKLERSYTNTRTYWYRIFAFSFGLTSFIATFWTFRTNKNQEIEKENTSKQIKELHEAFIKQNEEKTKQLESESWRNYITRNANTVYRFIRRDT